MTWRKWLLIVKCIATAVSAAQGGEYTPTLAAAGGYATAEAPAPLPGPAPGNICPACNGKGWNGDGTHRFKCEPCDGTGKRKTTASTTAAAIDPAPLPDLDAFYFAEHDFNEAVRLWPDAVPLLVFYWPSEADKAAVAYKNLWDRNTDGRFVVIPLCLSDQWDAETFVAQHWRRSTRQVVRLDGDQETTITDLKQLED